mgnify:CR=1 FL=1
MTDAVRALQRPLWANAAFSSASGFLLVVMPGWWAARIGVGPPWLLAGLGVALMAFAGLVLWAAARPVDRQAAVAGIIAADAGWVLATPVVMVAGAAQLTGFGQALLAGLAGVVALLGVLQWRGRRRLAALGEAADTPA